jgi:hypothetical protein
MIRQYNMEIISSEQQSINIQDGLFVRKTAKPTHTKKTQQIETNKPDGRGSF